MAAELVKRKRIRGGHRGVVSRKLAELKALLETEGDDPPEPDTAKLAQLELSLKEKLQKLKQLDGEIVEMLDSDGDISTEIEEAERFNEKIYEALVMIEQQRPRTPPSSMAGATPPGSTGGRGRPPHSRLPKLDLQKFDGDVTKWFTFWDAYTAAIHSNPDISDVDKFTYLQTLVERSAKDAISGLALTSANYEEAVEILERRFGNKQQIISKHMDILLNIESVHNSSQVSALRKLHDKIECNVRGLTTMGVTPESYGTLLTSVLLQKLPADLRLVLSRKETGEWSLTTLMQSLLEEIEARERTVTPRDDRVSQKGNYSGIKPTSATLLSSNKAPEPCCFCRGNHPPETCTAMASVEERRRELRLAGRCYICLRKGHVSRNCRSRWKCRQCSGRHHVSICQGLTTPRPPPTIISNGDRSERDSQSKPEQRKRNQGDQGASNTLTCQADTDKTVLLQTAHVTVFNPECAIGDPPSSDITVILDSGSQKSYITESICDRLNLRKEGKGIVSIVTFGNSEGRTQTCHAVRIGIKTANGGSETVAALTAPLICGPLPTYPMIQPQFVKHRVTLRDIESVLSNDLVNSFEQPEMLIGMDNYWRFVTGETLHYPQGPTATNTKFGWVLSGPMPNHNATVPPASLLVTHVLRVDNSGWIKPCNQTLDRQLERFWDLESLGILDVECTLLEQFKEQIKFLNGRYQVPLPWKDPTLSIPDNYRLCVKRFHNLLKRLRQSPQILDQYDQIIRDQQRLGIVESVKEPDVLQEGNRIHYLPHHAVIRRDKTSTKVRVVYDASARSQSQPSLNDRLHVGPKFNQNILDILVRFRAHRIALAADVEKAFLMVSVEDGDRDVLRFLWTKDVQQDPPELEILRFTRVVFGVASSPFLLNATIRHHISRYKEETLTS